MINADHYHSVEQAIQDAIRTSAEESRSVTLEATHATHNTLEAELYAECENHDGNGLFWGVNVFGESWQIQLNLARHQPFTPEIQ